MSGDAVSTTGEYLARIEGKIDVMAVHMERSQADIADLRQRIIPLEADRNQAIGEQRGIAKTVRAVYALATVCGLSGIAAAAKILLAA